MNVHARPEIFVGSVRGSQALERLLTCGDVDTVLDIGSGHGDHARIMRSAGKRVVTISLEEPADFVGDYCGMEFPVGFDAIWASHVIEHQPNVNVFLKKCFADLRPGGVFAITVPPAKDAVVGGHLTTWNAGILLYNLIVAGFDCRDARVSSNYSSGPEFSPYNISVIVRKRSAKLPELRCDSGDIERLAQFFPLPVCQGFDGRLAPINW